VEFTAGPQVQKVSPIVELTHQGKNLEDVPDQLIFDRVYIHGNPQLNSQRGIALNTRTAAVIDSWIDECHIHGQDSQGICVWDGPGPFKFVNNFIEGGAENIMFGGAKNSAESMVASDIEIRRNHLYKNPAWFGRKYPDNWVIKNLALVCERVITRKFEVNEAVTSEGLDFVVNTTAQSSYSDTRITLVLPAAQYTQLVTGGNK